MTSDISNPSEPILIPTELRDFITASDIALSLSSPQLEDTPLVLVNRPFESLTGYKASDIVGQNCRFLQGDATSLTSRLKIRTMINDPSVISEQVLMQNYRKSGEMFENFLFLFRINHAPLKTAYFLGSQFDTRLLEHTGRFETDVEKLSNVISRVSEIYFRDRKLDGAGRALMSLTIDAVAQARSAAAALRNG